MKISLFIPSLHNSAGMERISTGLSNLLCDRGHTCFFIVFGSNTDCFFPLHSSVEIYPLCCTGSIHKNRFLAAHRLRRFLKEHKPDVLINVDVAMIQVTALAFPQLMDIKVISWEQFSMADAHGLLPKLKRYVSVLCSKKMVVLTEGDRNRYHKFIRGRIASIGNFTTINSENKLASLKSKTVLSVGRLCNTKGFDLLLQAWREVYKELPEWNLRIVGGGSDEALLLGMIEDYELSSSVQLIQPTKNIGKEYLNASLYVLPSRFEPFGLVLIEAKAFGLPIFSFDCPYGPKEIIRNNEDGILVPNGDVFALAKTLTSLMSDREEIFLYGKAAYKDYFDRWSADAVIDKWEKLLNC